MDIQTNITGDLAKMVTIPSAFILVRYRLTLQALEPLHLPSIKGSALRGGFGYTFKRLACIQAWPCDKYCQLGNQCAYGYIFETAPPKWSEALRNFSDVPRPFVITSLDPRTHIAPTETLTFDLILIGKATEYRQSFETVFREMGRTEGLGKSKGKYNLLKVELVSEFGSQTLTARTATLPTDRITLNFLTSTRLKQQEDWVRQGPPFQALIKLLLGRVSSLSYFHCGQPFEADFRGLIDRAAKVQIVQSHTHWQDWSRFSGRQKQQIEMGGLVGQITYAGDLQEYLPLLALGELIHVGKGTVFGNGQYQIVGE